MRLRKATDRTQAANGRGGGIVGGVSLALEGARRQRLAARDCEQTDAIISLKGNRSGGNLAARMPWWQGAEQRSVMCRGALMRLRWIGWGLR